MQGLLFSRARAFAKVNPRKHLLGMKKYMKPAVTGCKIIGLFAVLTGFCGCASTESDNSSAEKERQARYSNYIDNTEKEWSTHF
jgi:hypothetical protein